MIPGCASTAPPHAGTFAESFWKRVFDSVLLPIFDHVRAEVRHWPLVKEHLLSVP
jgi:hypothetical protein